MAYNPWNTLGQNLATAGSVLRLPEFGLSERLGGVTGAFGQTPLSKNNAPENVLGLSSPEVPFNQGPSASPLSSSFGSLGNNARLSGAGGAGAGGGTSSGPNPEDVARLGQLNTQFDRLKSEGEGALQGLDSDLANAEAQANLGLSGLSSTITSKKDEAASARDKNIGQAASAAQNTVRSNRNTLRALGILNSSAAGDMLTRPMTEFDSIKAAYVQDYDRRVSELDNILVQETAKNKATLDALRGQYAQLKNNIQNDLRFNERERADAINSVNAAIASRISEVRNAQKTVSDRINTIRNTYDSMIAEIAGQKALTEKDFDLADYLRTAEIQFNDSINPNTVGLTPEEQRKKYVQSQMESYNKQKGLSQI